MPFFSCVKIFLSFRGNVLQVLPDFLGKQSNDVEVPLIGKLMKYCVSLLVNDLGEIKI